MPPSDHSPPPPGAGFEIVTDRDTTVPGIDPDGEVTDSYADVPLPTEPASRPRVEQQESAGATETHDVEVVIPAELDRVESEAEGARRSRPAAPAVAFDLLGGTGRATILARKRSRQATVVAALALAAVAIAVGVQWQDRDQTAGQLATVATELGQLETELAEASDSVLSEAELSQHVQDRRAAAFSAIEEELPYRYVFTTLLAVGAQLGLDITSIEFRGADITGGVQVSGTAENIGALGEWNTILRSRYASAVEGGFVENLSTTYRSLSGSEREAFNTTMDVTVAGLQEQLACTRLSPFLDGDTTGCRDIEPLVIPPLPEEGTFEAEPAPQDDAAEGANNMSDGDDLDAADTDT